MDDPRVFQNFQKNTTVDFLEEAKDVVKGMDYLVELSQSADCKEHTFRAIGMNYSELGHELNSKGQYGSMSRDRDMLRKQNTYDLELFKYTKELMRSDCHFYERLFEN